MKIYADAKKMKGSQMTSKIILLILKKYKILKFTVLFLWPIKLNFKLTHNSFQVNMFIGRISVTLLKADTFFKSCLNGVMHLLKCIHWEIL